MERVLLVIQTPSPEILIWRTAAARCRRINNEPSKHVRRCQKEGISSDPLDSLVGPDAIRSRILLQVERSPDVRVALRGLPPMVEEPRAPATPALPATPLFCSPINQYSIKNEDQLRFAPCLRRLCRRLCPSGFQQGATCRKSFCQGRRRRKMRNGIKYELVRLAGFRRSEGQVATYQQAMW